MNTLTLHALLSTAVFDEPLIRQAAPLLPDWGAPRWRRSELRINNGAGTVNGWYRVTAIRSNWTATALEFRRRFSGGQELLDTRVVSLNLIRRDEQLVSVSTPVTTVLSLDFNGNLGLPRSTQVDATHFRLELLNSHPSSDPAYPGTAQTTSLLIGTDGSVQSVTVSPVTQHPHGTPVDQMWNSPAPGPTIPSDPFAPPVLNRYDTQATVAQVIPDHGRDFIVFTAALQAWDGWGDHPLDASGEPMSLAQVESGAFSDTLQGLWPPEFRRSGVPIELLPVAGRTDAAHARSGLLRAGDTVTARSMIDAWPYGTWRPGSAERHFWRHWSLSAPYLYAPTWATVGGVFQSSYPSDWRDRVWPSGTGATFKWVTGFECARVGVSLSTRQGEGAWQGVVSVSVTLPGGSEVQATDQSWNDDRTLMFGGLDAPLPDGTLITVNVANTPFSSEPYGIGLAIYL